MVDHDYTQITPDPPDKDPTEYSFVERRAEILDLVMEAGSHRKLNKLQLADRYDVSRRTIFYDFERLNEFLEETLGERAKMRTQVWFERIVDDLLDEGEHRDAWRTIMEWNEWLADRGAIETVPDQMEVDATVREASTEGSEYRIVSETDDDEYVEIPSAKSDEVAELVDGDGE
jgi:AcrR family transcriptional regulator